MAARRILFLVLAALFLYPIIYASESLESTLESSYVSKIPTGKQIMRKIRKYNNAELTAYLEAIQFENFVNEFLKYFANSWVFNRDILREKSQAILQTYSAQQRKLAAVGQAFLAQEEYNFWNRYPEQAGALKFSAAISYMLGEIDLESHNKEYEGFFSLREIVALAQTNRSNNKILTPVIRLARNNSVFLAQLVPDEPMARRLQKRVMILNRTLPTSVRLEAFHNGQQSQELIRCVCRDRSFNLRERLIVAQVLKPDPENESVLKSLEQEKLDVSAIETIQSLLIQPDFKDFNAANRIADAIINLAWKNEALLLIKKRKRRPYHEIAYRIKKQQLQVNKGDNKSRTINGIFYSGHALDRMQQRGVTSSEIEHTIQHGVKIRNKSRVHKEGRMFNDTANKLAVITSEDCTRVITVIWGK